MKQRVLTALLAAPLVLALVFSANPVPILLLATASVYLAVLELGNLVGEPSRGRAAGVAAVFAALASLFLLHYTTVREGTMLLLLVGFLFALVRLGRLMVRGQTAGMFWPGVLWIAMPLLGLLLLHFNVPKTKPDVLFWPNPLLMALVPIWVGDTLAILVGSKVGKRPLWPELSPKKTWEGAVANLAGCVVSAVLLASSIGLTTRQGLMIGLVAGILGQYGDIFESALKRACGAKDSGSFMPGHGGILDRMDSILLPALPIAALILYYR